MINKIKIGVRYNHPHSQFEHITRHTTDESVVWFKSKDIASKAVEIMGDNLIYIYN